ncbi:MAG TPA: hypothetical protein VL651_10120 [Bacteroidia bacterium]|jgi:hypothetical protein|nr:hypothetical protein [Bacteroidia bacterium]
MNTITCEVQSKTVVAIIVVTLIGLGMIIIPMFSHTYHHTSILMMSVKITGWIFFVVGLLSILVMKKVVMDQNGITVEYYIGKKVHYRFDEIVDVAAEINAGAASIGGRMSHDGKHKIILTAVAGKQRIMITSASFTNFEQIFNALFQAYGTKFRVVDRGVRVG